MFDVIAFDADDTLWHNERLYAEAQARLRQLLSPYSEPDVVDEALYEIEMRNLEPYGYGIKAFALSMIETAVTLSNGRISANQFLTIINTAKEMIAAKVELLPGVAETLAELRPRYDLMLITKGDLLDQERKVARSGLGDNFTYVEVVADKNSEIYGRLLARHSIQPERFLMVGNSLRSDVLPIVALGGTAVHIPHHLTWAHENDVDPALDANGYYQLTHMNDLLGLLADLA